jgi:hypothetical protein
MNMTALGAARERRKAERAMESNADGTSLQEGDHVRIKRAGGLRRLTRIKYTEVNRCDKLRI